MSTWNHRHCKAFQNARGKQSSVDSLQSSFVGKAVGHSAMPDARAVPERI